jgi:hypothetical protein
MPTSPKFAARIAGSLYLLASLGLVLALSLRSGVIVPGDAARTADDLRASASLFRVSLAMELVAWACFLLTAMALYALLHHVDRLVAAAMVVFAVVLVAVGYVNDINLYTALAIATDGGYARALGADGASALVLLPLQAQSNGFLGNELFFGLWLLPLSHLVLRSRQLPRVVGYLLVVAAVNWILQFVVDVAAPGIPYRGAVTQIGGLGELVFVAWLLIFGIGRRSSDEAIQVAS